MAEVTRMDGQARQTRLRLGKTVMVPVWSSGFVVGTIALALRVRWPSDRRTLARMVLAGLLLQAAQFAGIFLALQYGVAAGLTALLAGSSPLLVAVLATF